MLASFNSSISPEQNVVPEVNCSDVSVPAASFQNDWMPPPVAGVVSIAFHAPAGFVHATLDAQPMCTSRMLPAVGVVGSVRFSEPAVEVAAMLCATLGATPPEDVTLNVCASVFDCAPLLAVKVLVNVLTD